MHMCRGGEGEEKRWQGKIVFSQAHSFLTGKEGVVFSTEEKIGGFGKNTGIPTA